MNGLDIELPLPPTILRELRVIADQLGISVQALVDRAVPLLLAERQPQSEPSKRYVM